jgi:hypothetical protein
LPARAERIERCGFRVTKIGVYHLTTKKIGYSVYSQPISVEAATAEHKRAKRKLGCLFAIPVALSCLSAWSMEIS